MANYIKKKELIKEVKLSFQNKKVNNKLCDMFYLIAKNLASSYMFDYEDKQDMMQMAVEYCIKYFDKFDTEKDVFAYITQICKHAFYQFFNRENKYKIFITEMLTNASNSFEKKYRNK